MFDKNFIGRVSSTANNDVTKIWLYNGSATGSNEAVATIAASGYFNDFQVNLTLGLGPLGVNDLIFILGNDAYAMYTVTTVVTNVTVSVFAATGVVGTANIDNLAVTTAKLDDLAVTTGKIAANAVDSSKLALTTVQYLAVPITAAQFNGMYAAPKLLVPAAGANTLLVLDRVELAMTYVSANYAAGGVAAVQYDSTANGAGVIASTTNAAASFQAAASTAFAFNQGGVLAPFSTCVNKGLYLSNITGAFTTGDSTFVAHCWFKVIPTV